MSVVMISTLGTLLYPGSLYSQRRPPLTFRAEESGASVRLERIGNPPVVRLQVSLDGDTWSDYAVNTSIALANIGDSVLIRAKGTNSTFSIGYDKTNRASYYHFSVVGRVSSRGDVMSLLAKDGERMDVPKMCFWRLFYNCSTLTSAPYISGTRLSYGCYMEMFKGCTSLTSAQPVLPALELAGSCYESMYEGCTNMMRSPVLPAEIPDYRSYRRMFCGCSRLREVEVGMREWNVNNFSETDWLRGVSREGVFKCPIDLCVVKPSSRKEGMVRVATVPSSWTLSYTDDTTNLCFTSEEANATLCLNRVGSPNGVSLEYFTTVAGFWQDYGIGTTVMLPNIGDRVYFRAKDWNATFSKSTSDYYQFAIVGRVGASGNIMSLLDISCQQKSVPDYAFIYLFRGCRSLTQSPELPATELSPYCYCAMFNNCVNLLSPPSLPAREVKMASYASMFYWCKSLTRAPELPARIVAPYCYSAMFYGCSEMVSSMEELPAKKLAYSCYEDMFTLCSKMESMPRIKATELASNCCWGMFSSCSNLVHVTPLLAKDLAGACYGTMFVNCLKMTSAPVMYAERIGKNSCYQMFRGCSSLRVTPTLQAKSLGKSGYQEMFRECTSLEDASNVRISTTDSNCCADMFTKCTRLTKTPLLGALDLSERCYVGMFSKCRSLKVAPALPAHTLAKDCYGAMFADCVGLEEAPALPADTLAENCYSDMFRSCTSLTVAPDLKASTLAIGCYSAMFKGCTKLVQDKSSFKRGDGPDSCYIRVYAKAGLAPMYSYREMFSGCSKLKRLVVDMGRWSLHSSDNWLKGTAVGDTGEFIGPLSSLYDMENYPYISAYYTDDSHLPANWKGWLLNQAYANDTTATFKMLQGNPRKYYSKKPAGVEIIEDEEADWLTTKDDEVGDMKPVEKIIERGRVYIKRGGVRYSLMGQRVYAIKDEE